MNLVLIADGHPREWPILHEVSTHFPDAVWLKPTYSQTDPEAGPEERDPLKDRMGWFYRQFRDRVRRQMTKRKVEVEEPDFKQKIELPYYELDRKKGLDLLDEIDPDIIVTCRAPILSPELLEKANWCGINVHFGLVPDYRGNEGLFWAALKDDTQSLGGSIHMLEGGVDTGSIIADAFPRLNGSESETMIDLKVSEVLSRALVDSLKSIARQGCAPVGKPQTRTGRNYRAKERTFLKDLRYYTKRIGTKFAPREERQQFY